MYKDTVMKIWWVPLHFSVFENWLWDKELLFGCLVLTRKIEKSFFKIKVASIFRSAILDPSP